MHVPERVIRPHTPKTHWLASAELPTRFGQFQTHVFRTTEPGDAVSLVGARLERAATPLWFTRMYMSARSVGTVVGLCGCAGGLSGFLTTKLVGLIVDRFSFVPVFVAAGVMYPIGFLVILLTIGRVQRIGRRTAAPTS